MSTTAADEGRRSWSRRPETPPGGDGDNPPRWSLGWRTVAVFAGLLVLNYLLTAFLYARTATPRVELPYTPTFLAQVDNGNVKSITSKGNTIQGSLRHAIRYPAKDAHAQPTTAFKTEVPSFASDAALYQLLLQKNVAVTAKPLQTSTPWWEQLLVGFGPTLLFIGAYVWFMRKYGGRAGGMFSFGASKAKQYQPTKEHVSFTDVAGIDEAKEELTEVVDFLREPDRYRQLGARIPRGVLLTGLPGTGKTLLAKAVAGEANVPFFSMSASEFVEMIVGVGASRVRDLFAKAKAAAPSIIFIDEIDAIGRARGSGVYAGANDEREQTLNQILTEMDGFDAATGVIVLAATNRLDVLDPALLRPGRFDRRVAIQVPDKVGREAILRVHTRGIPLAGDVDLDTVAASTVGMAGADLANLANEAALLAARLGHERVTMADFTDSLEKIELGAARRLTLSPEDRRRTAYHESGHALIGMLSPGADPVRKISIIPRSMSLGVTWSAPAVDRFNYDKQSLLARIRVFTGGRAAEEVVYGDETTGAEADIKQATQIARSMVGRFGMSDEIGFVAVLSDDGQSYAGISQVSERTRQRIDDEIKRIVGEAHQDAIRILNENRDRLDVLADALVRAETLDEADAYRAAGLDPPSETGVTAAEPAPPLVGAAPER